MAALMKTMEPLFIETLDGTRFLKRFRPRLSKGYLRSKRLTVFTTLGSSFILAMLSMAASRMAL